MIPLAAVAVVTLGASSCDNSVPKNSAAQRSQRLTETYQQRLETAVPYPLDAMKDSIERRNLRERLLRFNRPDKIGYVYLLSDTGSVVAFYTIKGKISSTESQLTASDVAECHHNDCAAPVVRQSPGDDGSYGPNEPGVFFFTTEDVLVQWNGKVIYADAPLQVKSAPLLVSDPNAKPSSTSDTPK
jgi:hypothetical protein